MKRRARAPARAPDPPTVPELMLAPELAALILLQHALDVAVSALVAEHPTLVDDVARQRDGDPAVALAHAICRRSGALEDILHRYRRVVRDAARSTLAREDDLPF